MVTCSLDSVYFSHLRAQLTTDQGDDRLTSPGKLWCCASNVLLRLTLLLL